MITQNESFEALSHKQIDGLVLEGRELGIGGFSRVVTGFLGSHQVAVKVVNY